jgi:hypothetical protein
MADQTAQSASGQTPRTIAPAGSTRPKGGTGGKRYVRTQQGAKRYGKPVGAEIVANPRDARGAKAQTDQESVGRYKSLVSGDSKAQSAAMQKLTPDQLARLSEVAFSFKSNDQNVVRLRVGVAAEMKRRGMDVNQHGGLGGRGPSGPAPKGGQTGAKAGSAGPGIDVINWSTGERTHVATKGETAAAKKSSAEATRASAKTAREQLAAAKKAQHDAEVAARKAAAEKARLARAAEAEKKRKQTQADTLERIRANNVARQSSSGKKSRVVRLSHTQEGPQMSGFRIDSVQKLRAAVDAFGRVRPERRSQVASYIWRSALDLSATHIVSRAVCLAAQVDPDTVLELAGKWKHGWIPLDATAVTSKTKGKKGANPWWSGGADAGPLSSHKRKQLEHRDRHTPNELKGGSDREYLQNLRKHTPNFLKPQAQNKRQARGPLPSATPKAAPVKKAAPSQADTNRGIQANKDYNRLTSPQKTEYQKHRASGLSHHQAMAATTQGARFGRLTPKHEGGKLLPKHVSGKLTPRNNNRSPVTSKTYAKNAPATILGYHGSEWRKNEHGTYDRYVNGQKSGHLIDQGLSRREIATHNRGTKFPKSDATQSAGERETYARNSRSSRGSLSVQKSIDRQRRKQTGERVAKPEAGITHHVERGLKNADLEPAITLRTKEFKPGSTVTAEGFTYKVDRVSRRKGFPNGQAIYHMTLVSAPDHAKVKPGSTVVRSGGESHFKKVRSSGKVTFVEPVTERKSSKPFANPQASTGRSNLQQRTGNPQRGSVAPSQGPGVPVKRTTVVKSGVTPEQTSREQFLAKFGSKQTAGPSGSQERAASRIDKHVTATNAAKKTRSAPASSTNLTPERENELTIQKRALEQAATRRKMTKAEQTRYARIKAELSQGK